MLRVQHLVVGNEERTVKMKNPLGIKSERKIGERYEFVLQTTEVDGTC